MIWGYPRFRKPTFHSAEYDQHAYVLPWNGVLFAYVCNSDEKSLVSRLHIAQQISFSEGQFSPCKVELDSSGWKMVVKTSYICLE